MRLHQVAVAFALGLALCGMSALQAEAQGLDTCWTCYPSNPGGTCRPNQAGQGYTKCKTISLGCDHFPSEECEGEPTEFSPDNLLLADGTEVRGKLLEQGVFSIRTCGSVLGVLYSDEAEAVARLRVARIEFLPQAQVAESTISPENLR